MGCADARLPDHPERVIVLEEQLARRVEPEPPPPSRAPRQQLLRPGDDAAHRRVPVRLDEPITVADQRTGESFLAPVRMPAEQVLGIDPSVVHPVFCPAPDPDDPAALHRYVETIAVRVQDRRRRNPCVDVGLDDAVGETLVHPHRPWRTPRPDRRPIGVVGRAEPPRIRDPILTLLHNCLQCADGHLPPTATFQSFAIGRHRRVTNRAGRPARIRLRPIVLTEREMPSRSSMARRAEDPPSSSVIVAKTRTRQRLYASRIACTRILATGSGPVSRPVT